MDSLTRVFVIGAPGVVILLALAFPALGLVIILLGVVLALVCVKVGMHTTPEPLRPIIYRWGQMHRLGPGGVIFLVPGIDAIGPEQIDLRPITQDFVVSQIHSADGDSVYLNLELSWQFRPDIDRITPAMKLTFVKSPEQLRRMIDHTVSVVARQLMLNYSAAQLRRADLRENATEILRDAVNELLAPHGLMLDTLFWRGSVPASEYLQAKLAMKIAHERLEAVINDVQLVRERLPDVAPGEFLAQQAWIDLLRRGVTPPQLPGLPYMPPPPAKTSD